MSKPPLSITLIGWLFISAGIVGAAYHATELNIHDPFANDAGWIIFVRLLAIVGGIFTLRGANWGRWLLVVWMVYHVCLSYFHSFSQMAAHAVLLVLIAFFLFRPEASAYFKRKKLS